MRKLQIAAAWCSIAMGGIGCGVTPPLPANNQGTTISAWQSRGRDDDKQFLEGVRYAIQTEMHKMDWQAHVIGLSLKKTSKPCVLDFNALVRQDAYSGTYKYRVMGKYDGCLWRMRIDNVTNPINE